MKYFDTSYLVRLYYQDAGWQNVRAIAATDYIASSLIGRAETVAAFHRKFREGSLDKNSLAATVDQFNEDCSSGAFHWLPISERVIDRLTMVFKRVTRTSKGSRRDPSRFGRRKRFHRNLFQ